MISFWNSIKARLNERKKQDMPLEAVQVIEAVKDKKYLLQNSENIHNNLFFKNYPIDFERVGAFGIPIKDGIASVKIKEPFYICRINEHAVSKISTYTSGFFLLQIFLDHFRDNEQPLPELGVSDIYHDRQYETAAQINLAMQIMIMPLNSFEAFINRVRLIESTFDKTILYPYMDTSSINTWSWGDPKTANDCETVQQVNANEWQILYWERGGSRVVMTLFEEKYVYEYFIDAYLHVV